MEAGEEYTKHMGKYPVIFMSLKSAKQPTFEMAYQRLQEEIAREYKRHSYVLDGEQLLSSEKKRVYFYNRGDSSIKVFYSTTVFV